MKTNSDKVLRFRDALIEHFDRSELQNLCFDISADYEQLKGDTLSEKTRELIAFCYRHNTLTDLLSACKQLRPKVMWPDIDRISSETIQQIEKLPLVHTPRVGKIPKPLSIDEEEEFLSKHTDWKVIETSDFGASRGIKREIYRVYEFASFKQAFDFMVEVSEHAISPASHHPRWQNTYNRVEIWITTLNLDYTLSQKDIKLAQVIEQIWRKHKIENLRLLK